MRGAGGGGEGWGDATGRLSNALLEFEGGGCVLASYSAILKVETRQETCEAFICKYVLGIWRESYVQHAGIKLLGLWVSDDGTGPEGLTGELNTE